MMALVLGHHSDLATIPMPTSAVSAAPANAYVLARGVAGGAVTTARAFAGAAAARPGAGAASAGCPAAAPGGGSRVGTLRALFATGSGAASPTPRRSGPAKAGPKGDG